jgi:hypothetical protein
MWKKLLVTASFVLLGSFTAFSQQDKATSCPTDTKEVREKVQVDVGVGKYERETRECRVEKRDRDKPEPKDKPEPRERRESGRSKN